MRRWIGLGSFALLGLVACGDDSSCPTCPQATFAFRIAVRDAAGEPVPGLQASLLYPPLPGFPGVASRSVEALNATAVRFTAPESALVTLDVLDLAHRLVAQPLASYPALPGYYTIAVAPDAPYGVYWIRLVARRGESAVFRDSIRAAWWPIDPTTNVLGSTDADGVLQTQDALRFPNVLDLPPLVGTNATGDSLGTFSYPDTVSLVLTEPPGGPVGRLSVYRLVVRPGANDFQLDWPNPANVGAPVAGPAAPAGRSDEERERRVAKPELVLTPVPVEPPATWHLYQNAPNPTN